MGDKIKTYIKSPNKIIITLYVRGIKLVNERTFLKILYKYRTGKKLDLNKPKTFNEKLQWLKLHDRKPEYSMMVDKYEVRKYIKNKIGEDYLIPLLGIWDKFDDINFGHLPNQFVLKCTHDSGGLIICRDKSRLDIESAKKKINASLKKNFYYHGLEWPYKNVKPRIIAEQYMEEKDNVNNNGLTDYKFYCFNGEPNYLYVSEGLENHSTAKISFFNLDFTRAPFEREDYKPFDSSPKKPINYEKMLELSKLLSKGHSFIRVDFYEIQNKIYFSELTFSPCSGFMPFKPEKFDLILGEKLILRKETYN